MLSIVIPYFNDVSFITEAVTSAKLQSITNKEIIIVNDGSSSEATTFIEKFESETVRIIHQQNKGLSGARNTGIKNAKGKYIMLLDSDDKFDATFAEKAISVFEQDSNIGVVTCWGKRFIDNKILNEFKPKGGGIDNFIFCNNAIGTSMILKKCWEEIGGYDEQMTKGYEDWEFYLRLTQKWRVEVIQEFLFYYRQRANSMRMAAMNNYDLEIKKYIFNKNKEIFTKKYDLIMPFLLSEIDRYKKGEIKQQNKLEFKIGKALLKPLRIITQLFK